MVPLSFGSQHFMVLPDGGLFWPEEGALIVADLHFEKASAFARLGQMLPPFDSLETAARLEQAASRCGARAIWCLGDSYHDANGEDRMDPAAAAVLRGLAARLDLVWIAGNHDPVIHARWGGRAAPEHEVRGLWLRHEALPDDGYALCGHYHPKLRLPAGGRSVTRRCFVRSERRLILPAYGALTGGLDAGDPAVTRAAVGPAEALIPVAGQLLHFPLGVRARLPRSGAAVRRRVPRIA